MMRFAKKKKKGMRVFVLHTDSWQQFKSEGINMKCESVVDSCGTFTRRIVLL